MKVHSTNQQAEDAPLKRGRGRPIVDDKRRRILDAALKVFAAKGFHGTSVPEVADAAGVATGSVYVYFEDKQNLVNEVYRDAKQQLKTALLDGLAPPDIYDATSAERWFHDVWQRLSAFAMSEPDAFRFLEMQDHVEYLDAKSRTLELSVLGPLFLAGKNLRDRGGGPPVDIAIALLWGAFVGVVKAGRLGYLHVDAKKLADAGRAAWRLIAPTTSRATDTRTSATSHAKTGSHAPGTSNPSRANTASHASGTSNPSRAKTASNATDSKRRKKGN